MNNALTIESCQLSIVHCSLRDITSIIVEFWVQRHIYLFYIRNKKEEKINFVAY